MTRDPESLFNLLVGPRKGPTSVTHGVESHQREPDEDGTVLSSTPTSSSHPVSRGHPGCSGVSPGGR